MPENEIFLLDTNILIYAYDKTEARKHEIAKNLIIKCLAGKQKLAVSSQNLSEFFSVTTAKGLLTKEDAIGIISDIISFSGWIKIDFDHKTVLDAAVMSAEYAMSYWDSLLAATMKKNSVVSMYTENSKDFKAAWLNVVDPFETLKKKRA